VGGPRTWPNALEQQVEERVEPDRATGPIEGRLKAELGLPLLGELEGEERVCEHQQHAFTVAVVSLAAPASSVSTLPVAVQQTAVVSSARPLWATSESASTV